MYKEEYLSYLNDYLYRSGYDDEFCSRNVAYARKLLDNNLPVVFNHFHLADLIGYEYQLLYSISNSTKSYYKTYYIEKNQGGKRKISEPLPTLKDIQYWFLKNIFENIEVHPCAKAYKKGETLVSNAKFHTKQNKVVKIDLKNFFPSIEVPVIVNALTNLGYSKRISYLIANLCCINGHLPQGAPTSPVISNIVFSDIDEKLFLFCRKNKIRYTRYADDMTFSGNNIITSELLDYINLCLINTKFRLNKKKTKIFNKSNRQIVTGIVVNDKMQTSINYRKKIRQEIYYIKKYGIASHIEFINNKKNRKEFITNYIINSYINMLLGKIAFVLLVDKKNKEFVEYKEFLQSLKQ